ncbi:hypothetical protein JZ751_000314 [Albula glossodonta]|uniref:Uncharacterized protein n=1 Tax=Albula glossodonta TaxID=121402 RepID=A0A8T2PW82_9TELE|nr:hypothetical protein JZ751_000314 [Albula glossodonta]
MDTGRDLTGFKWPTQFIMSRKHNRNQDTTLLHLQVNCNGQVVYLMEPKRKSEIIGFTSLRLYVS